MRRKNFQEAFILLTDAWYVTVGKYIATPPCSTERSSMLLHQISTVTRSFDKLVSIQPHSSIKSVIMCRSYLVAVSLVSQSSLVHWSAMVSQLLLPYISSMLSVFFFSFLFAVVHNGELLHLRGLHKHSSVRTLNFPFPQ